MTSPHTSKRGGAGATAQYDAEAPQRDGLERTPSFDEMLDGCILRLIHELPPTGLAPRRDRG